MKSIVLEVRYSVKERLRKNLQKCRNAAVRHRYVIIFNVLNGNAIRTATDTVGTSLGQVTAILPGRFPRIAYQFKW